MTGKFTTHIDWELVRSKEANQDWSRWISHKSLPKKISICMWKVYFQFLPFDERICKLRIPIVLACNCNEIIKKETTDHVLGTGNIACYVQRRAIETFSIFNVDSEPWKVKVHYCSDAQRILLFKVFYLEFDP